MAIWSHDNYRDYLLEKLGNEGSRTGERKRLAAFIPVHTTFISQVLKGKAELSLEQAEAINSFLQHSDDEGEFFILLVLRDRAGDSRLKDRFARKIQKYRDDRTNIQNRLEVKTQISAEDRDRYYSSYIYGAIHVLTSIPQFQTVEALANSLRFPRAQIQNIVEFLLRIGVLKETDGHLAPGINHVHLGNDSEIILKHHSNWRFHTVANLQVIDRDDLHYSACFSLTRADVLKIKESILQNLKTNVETVAASKEEVAYVLNFDFYKLSSGD